MKNFILFIKSLMVLAGVIIVFVLATLRHFLYDIWKDWFYALKWTYVGFWSKVDEWDD
jgi:hypothetical protein